jgi:cell fate (sporulation/competence/biofilm development) regulator YlbF (YheA/YmcA/DUF963 family)
LKKPFFHAKLIDLEYPKCFNKSKGMGFMGIKEFKEKQRQQQLRYIEGTKPTEAEQQYMQNLYSIIIQNADGAKFFESEIRLNVLLADIQKILTEGIKDVLEF